MVPPQKIGLFGGTFDPIHLGHLHLATLAKEALALDEVRFLPCPISPHKFGTSPASGHDRIEMLRLATAEIPWAIVDDYELQQEGPCFSYLTAKAMAAKFPTSQLYWILGSDQWKALPRWEKPECLAHYCEFVVLTRGDSPQPRAGYTLHIIQREHPASATQIRREISISHAHSWLSPRVATYILELDLYR